MVRAITVVIFICLTARTKAVGPPYNFSDKSDRQLLNLLNDRDRKMRFCAAVWLGDRYKNPSKVTVGSTHAKTNSPSPNPKMVPKITNALQKHLKSDPDRDVRDCSLQALSQLRYWTNCTSLVAFGLFDSDSFVRIKACSFLIEISSDYHESLHPQVVETLRACLRSTNDVETIWYASYSSEPLGTNGLSLVPDLRDLTGHKSEKVRDYAQRALDVLEPKKPAGSQPPP
jgi:hypothetical protein